MRKLEEVLRLHPECGHSNRAIAQAVRASPTTVGDYLRRARLAGLVWPLVAGMTEAALEAALFPPLPAASVKCPEPNWAAVHRQVGRAGLTECAINLYHPRDNSSRMLTPFNTDAQVSQSASSTLLYLASKGFRVAVVRSMS